MAPDQAGRLALYDGAMRSWRTPRGVGVALATLVVGLFVVLCCASTTSPGGQHGAEQVVAAGAPAAKVSGFGSSPCDLPNDDAPYAGGADLASVVAGYGGALTAGGPTGLARGSLARTPFLHGVDRSVMAERAPPTLAELQLLRV